MSAQTTPAKMDEATKPKALVVDDEVDNLDLMKRVLRKDYDVFAADSDMAVGKTNDTVVGLEIATD